MCSNRPIKSQPTAAGSCVLTSFNLQLLAAAGATNVQNWLTAVHAAASPPSPASQPVPPSGARQSDCAIAVPSLSPVQVAAIGYAGTGARSGTTKISQNSPQNRMMAQGYLHKQPASQVSRWPGVIVQSSPTNPTTISTTMIVPATPVITPHPSIAQWKASKPWFRWCQCAVPPRPIPRGRPTPR